MADKSKILAFIASSDDTKKLKQLVLNAKELGDKGIETAAFKRLIEVSPAERPGTLEHDFWQTIYAFEYMLTEERGKTTRLSRTRQKIARSGIAATLEGWAHSKPTDGFKMLMERSMPELTGEAIILRHHSRFSEETLLAARQRLVEAGVDPQTLPN